MKRRRTILFIALGLAISTFACGRDADPTQPSTSTIEVATGAAISTILASDAAQLAAPTQRRPLPDGPQSVAPVYEIAATWGKDPNKGVSFASPNGIAIDSSDNVYVTEFRGNRVQKFTSDGVLVAQWGSGGSEDGQFRNPTGIAVDREGNVSVSESGNHRVQKFTADGQWLASWGSRGTGQGEFLSAMVVATDADGKVYVSDWGNSRIQVFDTDGNYIESRGQQGSAPGLLAVRTNGTDF